MPFFQFADVKAHHNAEKNTLSHYHAESRALEDDLSSSNLNALWLSGNVHEKQLQ